MRIVDTRIKYVADIFGRIGFRGYTEQDVTYEGNGAITLSPSNFHDMKMDYGHLTYLSWDKYYESPEIQIENGDILFVKTGSTYGKSCFVSDLPMEATINPQLIVFKNFKMNGKLFAYVLQTDGIRNQCELAVVGGTIPTMSQKKIGNFQLQIPFYPEDQNAVVKFLDSKCSEIDALTVDIQSQINTLEQYKRSVITEAVTKGLNKDVEMKESGIPFIGAIPAHWKSDKLKYHLQRNEPRNPGEQEVLSLYRDYGIVPKDSRNDNFNVTSEDTTNYKYVRVGDFVINKMKAWQGSVAVSDYEGIVSPAYYVYKFTDDNIYRRYFHYLLRACYKDEFMRLSGGIRVGQWDLSATALENTCILLPPYEEQVIIADYLDDKKKDIDDAIAFKHDQLATLDAYKKSIIYEYVTGKKEVPSV